MKQHFRVYEWSRCSVSRGHQIFERWRNGGCRMTRQHFHLITFQAKVTGQRDPALQCSIAAPHLRSGAEARALRQEAQAVANAVAL